MAIARQYDPTQVEDKWYSHWLEKGYFRSKPDPTKEAYTIVIPPPNVTGVLHMGHMLNNTIQDILIRKARMEGKEACWVPGTDHASIATEAKVVAMLKEKGIEKNQITREAFLEYALEWKNKYGGIILDQLKKLGASCDWDRTKFTMDEDLSQSVTKVFVDLFKKGYIYRGYRMVNWDPQGKTALADDEVIHKEVNSKLYHIRYELVGEEGHVLIATTRPETLLADTAVCIHPEDERYKHLHGKKVRIPLENREVPIILDEYVSMEFGTGCLKVTPAHDVNDYELGKKHKLAIIDMFHEDGRVNDQVSFFQGEDRFVVRKKIAKLLKEKGHLEKVEDYTNSVGFSERTDAVVEPRLSMQWYVKMDPLKGPALENVLNDTIQLHPPKFKNMYRSWMENIHDWCISRQLWWGHRIPAYYMKDGDFVVAESGEEALELARKKSGNPQLQASDLKQDDDVLDTWFSSGLWPISVFNGILEPENEEIQYYYPTNDLVTAPEILFFWVARMIINGYEYRSQRPFKNVYLTGIVRDKLGRKMSKSLGNSPDPLELIKQYGADGVRTGMLFSSPAGNDLLFDVKLCEQGRNFSNKIWNAFRLIKGWEVKAGKKAENEMAVQWFEARLNKALTDLEDHFSKFRISDALMTAYKLAWDDFCSWYLEMVKPPYGEAIDEYSYQQSIVLFEKVLKVLHPFMPFITEELWHEIQSREEGQSIMIARFPEAQSFDEELLRQGDFSLELIREIRNVRNAKQISPKTSLDLVIKGDRMPAMENFGYMIGKLANLSEWSYTESPIDNCASFRILGEEFYIPLEDGVDLEKEKEELSKELEYTQGFLASVMNKLSNERFVNNAPEQVVAMEKKKKADAEAKIQAIEESLRKLDQA